MRRLRHLLRLHKPLMVFLMEMKIDNKRMEVVRQKLGFLNEIDLRAGGSKRSLFLAWKGDV